MNRKEILAEDDRLTHGDREKNYGSALTNHQRIASLWSTFLQIDISPAQVAICMGLVKVARLIETPNHLDSFIDLAAYAAISGEISHID